MARSFPNEANDNVVILYPKTHFSRSRHTSSGLVGLTIEETIELEALDALAPLDDRGNIAWAFEGEPTTEREKRWLELYQKHEDARKASIRGLIEFKSARFKGANNAFLHVEGFDRDFLLSLAAMPINVG